MALTLHEKAIQCVQDYKKSEKALLDILGEIDETRTYLRFGVSSLFRYCVEVLKLSESETFRFTQVARKSKEVPELKAAIQKGILTVSRASRIAPVITPGTHALWIEKAANLTQKELEREVVKQNPREAVRERVKVVSAELSELRIPLDPQLEELLKRTQEVLRTKTIEDTMRYALNLTLQHKDPLERAKRARTSLSAKSHTKTPSLRQVPESEVPTGRHSMLRSQTTPKANRTPIPSALKHQVFQRDQGKCQYLSCHEARWVEIHHIKPISYGGIHEIENLTTLCSRHHASIHRT